MSPEAIVLFIFHVISLVSGLLGNMFILGVNFMDWIKRSSVLDLCDVIHSCLAVSNIGILGFTCVLQNYQSVSQASILMDRATYVFFAAVLCLRCCSLWFATWFSVYCFVKIVRFGHSSLLRLVKIVLEKLPWLLLSSTLLSMATSLPIVFKSDVGPLASLVNNSSNSTIYTVLVNDSTLGLVDFDTDFAAYLVHILLVLGMFLFSSVSIIIILCRHMKLMGENAEGFRNPRLDGHLSAVKTVASILVLYCLYFLAYFLRYFANRFFSSTLWTLACDIVIGSFPVLTALIVILRIPKLKKTLCDVVFLAACCVKA